MKKIFYIGLLLLLLVGCNNKMKKILNSKDTSVMLKAADEYYQEKKYKKAIEVYDVLVKYVAGTDDASEVAYKTAMSNFYDENYRLAAHQLSMFSSSFPKDPRVEEVSFMSAKCYYIDSPDYNLDQTNTNDAIRELQLFIDRYPNSSRVAECNKMMSELTAKLEKKAFENAKTYYKIMEYKAATVAFENLINDFPESKNKEEIELYLLRSKFQLAINSYYLTKNERIEDASIFNQQFIKKYPSSKYMDECNNISEKLVKSKAENEELIQKIDKIKKEQEQRQREFESEQALKEVKKTKKS